MHFKIIAAMCKNNGIGINNSLPWNIKEDLKHFSRTTKGKGNNAIVMGKNTWISIGEKSLPKRDNLILSNSLFSECANANMNRECPFEKDMKVFKSIDTLKDWCREKNYEEVWIIGGESIYKQFLNDKLVSELCITKIKKVYDCDTFFPQIDTTNTWKLMNSVPIILDNNNSNNNNMNEIYIESYQKII